MCKESKRITVFNPLIPFIRKANPSTKIICVTVLLPFTIDLPAIQQHFTDDFHISTIKAGVISFSGKIADVTFFDQIYSEWAKYRKQVYEVYP